MTTPPTRPQLPVPSACSCLVGGVVTELSSSCSKCPGQLIFCAAAVLVAHLIAGCACSAASRLVQRGFSGCCAECTCQAVTCNLMLHQHQPAQSAHRGVDRPELSSNVDALQLAAAAGASVMLLSSLGSAAPAAPVQFGSLELCTSPDLCCVHALCVRCHML